MAAEAGLTKGGLLYHFASREELVRAIHQHLADRWEADLVAAAGKPAAEASPAERLAAYARVTAQSATRAELLFMVEGSTTPEHAAPWDAVMERWAPPPPVPRATRRRWTGSWPGSPPTGCGSTSR
ncbi:TetR/AcrR family transcriptional regulator [Actinomadura keratinilytica]